ncbi:MAG: hypothetical protein IKD08_01585 [Alphaproteobacteria bacterium]|nr:hypothetical protein [Alphaproteobacteria bacterium]
MEKEDYFKFAKEHNMEVNEKVVDRILKRLAVTDGHCPCVPEDEWTDDHLCPCTFCEADVAANGHCHCNLFLKKSSEQVA